MRVQLGEYTYRWDGEEPLAVGDLVVAPATPWCGPTFKRVSAVGDDLGADYEDDELTPITGKLTPDRTPLFALPTSGSNDGSVPSTEEPTS